MKINRNSLVDILKFVFAIIIASFHLFSRYMGVELWSKGYLATDFFFLVSGYLFANSVLFSLRGEKSERSSEYRIAEGERAFNFLLSKYSVLWLPILFTYFIEFTVLHLKSSIHDSVIDLIDGIFEIMLLRNLGYESYSIMSSLWYVSAMIIIFFCIYPFIRKFGLTYVYWIAPVVAFTVFGFLFHEYDNLGNMGKYVGILCYKCQLRALAEIHFGIFSYGIVKRLQRIKRTPILTVICGLSCISLYVFSIYYMYKGISRKWDYQIVVFLMISIIMSFWLFHDVGTVVLSKFSLMLANLSIYIYLTHEMTTTAVLIKIMNSIIHVRIFSLYISIIAVALIEYLICEYIIKKRICPKIKSILVKKV